MTHYGTYRYVIMQSESSNRRKTYTLKLELEAGKPVGSNRSWGFWQYCSNTSGMQDARGNNAQSNLEEGRVAAKVSPHWLQWCALNSPQNYPFAWTVPQTPLPASSLDPSDLRCQTASGSDPPFFHNALDRPTDWQIVHGKVWWL